MSNFLDSSGIPEGGPTSFIQELVEAQMKKDALKREQKIRG